MIPVILLELNEISFDLVRAYIGRGYLPTLERLLSRHGLTETTSEQKYEELEPWIQWVTAHTGLTLGEHGVFRLGDIIDHDLPQIWEELEALGYRTGAVSPMNAKNRMREPAFFLPDPWTRTFASAPFVIRKLHEAMVQIVNENASARASPNSLFWLAVGTLLNARRKNYCLYARLLGRAFSRPWSRAIFLDLLLSDLFIGQVRRSRPHFASLFVNAGAHIQHHYMFSSRAYTGGRRNPEWYLPPGEDPVLEIYAVYDRIVANLEAALPEYRLMIATGLHQEPHDQVTFYWRLRNPEQFLKRISVPYRRVEMRMSRDFVVMCDSKEMAAQAACLLSDTVGSDGTPVFEVDNRGSNLFVMLSYPFDISPEFEIVVGNTRYDKIKEEVVFVALKNGKHNGIGYFIDTGVDECDRLERFPLKHLPSLIAGALAA